MEWLEYLPFVFLSWVARRLSFRRAGQVGAALAMIAYHLPLSRKGIARENISKSFPDLQSSQVNEIARGAFKNYGIALMEFLWCDGRSKEELVQIIHLKDFDIVTRSLVQHRSVILLSGHFGAWELIVQGLRHPLGRPMAVIVHPLRNRRVDRIVSRIRTQFGDRVIPMGVAVREVLHAIRGGYIIGMLGDQSGPKEAAIVNFFGRPAATHRGAAAFALKTKTPLVMVFFIRREDGTYDIQFVEVDRTGIESYSEEHVDEPTRRHTAILEQYIRLRPELWLWMHKRWKHSEYFQSKQPAKEAS